MADNQITLLKELAAKLNSQERTQQQARQNLVNAGILTKKGNFTAPYKDLERLFPSAK